MADLDAEFGFDISPDEEELLLQIASSIHATPRRPPHDVLVPHVPASPAVRQGPRDPADMFVPGEFPSQSHLQRIPRDHEDCQAADAADIRYPNLSAALRDLDDEEKKQRQWQRQQQQPPRMVATSPEARGEAGAGRASIADDAVVAAAAAEKPDQHDTRSPLERFRQFPRKPLTVSDLTSGAWCELQYEYTLTRLPGGRRVRTPAMRQGSKVHRKLEEEVHTTVRIDIMTKEDGFGLRLWNLVQGLRTLRDTGLTRELEVWGTVEGNLVNGVIDVVTSDHPDPDFEEQLFHQGSSMGLSQTELPDYFPRSSQTRARDDAAATASPAECEDNIKYYLADVKTRGSLAPVSPAVLRPAQYQLHLYHRFLSEMAAGRLDYLRVFERYGLDAAARFSVPFISQVADLHDEVLPDSPGASAAAPDILRYNTLAGMVSLVEDELRLTFPQGAGSLGHILRVQYIYRADGRELGSHNFPVSAQLLNPYLDGYMSWWKGERQAVGVDIEEAFKCGSCDFAADCSWRRDMDEERVRRARQKMAARGAARSAY
ncbi:Exonuclease V [Escovopsis weberi]|uniref:Exonuclease V n=1 Tax=Escovopsis weberi TaxID=150374 RepID=A0A0M8N4L8_ESCWE|nr:Exonuclease V [Escovopsis weberi]